jgi:hypothetical protein
MAIWYISLPFGVFHGHLVYFIAIWYISLPFGIFHGHLVYFMAIWYISWPFGMFLPVLACCTKKNLATLILPALCYRYPIQKDAFYQSLN